MLEEEKRITWQEAIKLVRHRETVCYLEFFVDELERNCVRPIRIRTIKSKNKNEVVINDHWTLSKNTLFFII